MSEHVTITIPKADAGDLSPQELIFRASEAAALIFYGFTGRHGHLVELADMTNDANGTITMTFDKVLDLRVVA